MRTRRFGNYHFLSEDEIKQVHSGTLRVLDQVGVRVPDERLLKLAESCGARVNYSDSVIRLPGPLVEKYLSDNAAFAKSVDEKKVPEDGDRRVTYGFGGQAVRAVDLETGQIRDATIEDMADSSRLASAIDEIKGNGGLFKSNRVPPLTDDLYFYHTLLSHTTKPVSMDMMHLSSIPWLEEMAIVMYGSREAVRKARAMQFTAYICSPLQYPKDAMAKMWAVFDRGYRVSMGNPMSVAGASAPVTLAGAAVSCNADAVSGMVLTRMIDAGHVAYHGASPITLDLRTGAGLYADPRKLVICGAMMDMSRFYGVPNGGFHIGADASVPGIQAAAERVFTAMVSLAYWEAPIFVRLGNLGPSNAVASLAQVMIDLEIGKMIEKFCQGIEVTPETLAVDEIIEAGIGGNFLGHDHTLEFFKQESWLPELFERRLPDGPVTLQDTVYEKAKAKAKELIKNTDVHPLAPDKQKALDDILKRAVSAVKG